MNFKKFFLPLLMICSITTVRAVRIDTSDELKLLQEVASLATQNASDKIFLIFHNKTKKEILEHLSKNSVGIFLLVWHCTESELKELSALLQYVQQQKPELMQQAFDRYVSQEKINFPIIETFIKFGANAHQNFKGKNFNAIEIVEARFGSRKIDGIKSYNCNSVWSKIFGQSTECKEMKKSLDFLKQKEAEAEKK